MSFLYCIPGQDNNSVNWRALGLSYAFTDDQPQRGLDLEGFTGEKSAILADRHFDTSRMRINRTEGAQTWKKAGEYWIGYWNDDKPTPASLKRPNQLGGKEIDSRVGRWLVPTAISFDEADGELFSQHHLSRYVSFDDDGEPIYGDVEAQFAPLYEIAMNWVNSNEEPWSLAQLWKCAGQVLSFNYRAGFHELCMLDVLTDQTAKAIMDVCVDVEGLEKLQLAKTDEKKSSTCGELSTSGGETADTDSIFPQLLTS